jgi:hypothetical protein
MALNDTRNCKGSQFNISAAPFQTSADFSVFDHLKYVATSTQSFPVSATGSVEISSAISAATGSSRRIVLMRHG